MATRAKCSPEEIQHILEVYQATGSLRETGRRLNRSEITIRKYIRQQKSICEFCSTPVSFGKRLCERCSKKVTTAMREHRKTRRREGRCSMCDEPIQPPSTQFCAMHRLSHQARSKRYKERNAPGQGVPTRGEREKQIRYNYGEAGIDAWHRDKASCVLCGVHYREKSVHIHHIDEDPTHNVAENLTCLCFRCHRMIHLLAQHPNPHHVLEWFVYHYPRPLLAHLMHHGQAKKRVRRTDKTDAPKQMSLVPVC